MSTGIDDLPEELLAHVVRRLPPRSLAVCRSVCKDWRAVVDARGLLLAAAHLVPRSLHGIFINHVGKEETHSFFSRGASPVDHALSFLPDRRMCHTSRVLDHRNGLLIYQNGTSLFVCNPATRWCAALPPPPKLGRRIYRHRLYLMFDPTVSLHYDALYLPEVPEKPKPYPERHINIGRRSSSLVLHYSYDNLPPSVREAYERDVNTVGSMEWPPFSYGVQVYSSRTGQWEETRFIREEGNNTAVTVSDIWSDPPAPSCGDMLRCHAVCWRGAFYVHCRGGFVMRFSLLEEKYEVIKTPRLDDDISATDEPYEKPSKHLAKSKHGVYYTSIHDHHLRVWILRRVSESSSQMPDWELKYQHDLKPSLLHHQRKTVKEIAKSWILDPVEDEQYQEWDSDDDSMADAEGETGNTNKDSTFSYSGVDILGYHPYKEVLFLGYRFRGYAYYLGSSKLRYLGWLRPSGLGNFPLMTPTLESFVYTPCMDDLIYA